jgi:hypothetical protein
VASCLLPNAEEAILQGRCVWAVGTASQIVRYAGAGTRL